VSWRRSGPSPAAPARRGPAKRAPSRNHDAVQKRIMAPTRTRHNGHRTERSRDPPNTVRRHKSPTARPSRRNLETKGRETPTTEATNPSVRKVVRGQNAVAATAPRRICIQNHVKRCARPTERQPTWKKRARSPGDPPRELANQHISPHEPKLSVASNTPPPAMPRYRGQIEHDSRRRRHGHGCAPGRTPAGNAPSHRRVTAGPRSTLQAASEHRQTG